MDFKSEQIVQLGFIQSLENVLNFKEQKHVVNNVLIEYAIK